MSIPVGLLLLCVAMALAVGGLILVQRLVPMALRRQHNDVAGFIYAVLGVTYAVLLGLMVVAVWEQWEAAADTADDEASSLAEIFWIADRLPESDGRHVQELARSYARVVVYEEWPLMEHEKSSPRAWDLLDEIRASLQDLDPSTPEQEILYGQSLERMRDLADARRDRLLEAEKGLPVILWVVLITGGIIVVGFTYLFGLQSTVIHLLMVGSLALIIALVLFTVAALNYPFKGDITIDPEAMKHVLGRFQSSKLSDL
jgi:nucleotide-binding universal stress UspA family protein